MTGNVPPRLLVPFSVHPVTVCVRHDVRETDDVAVVVRWEVERDTFAVWKLNGDAFAFLAACLEAAQAQFGGSDAAAAWADLSAYAIHGKVP